MGKYVHVCPNCGVAKGFKGQSDKPNLECLNCGFEITWDEWKNSPIKPKPGYKDYFIKNPDEFENLILH